MKEIQLGYDSTTDGFQILCLIEENWYIVSFFKETCSVTAFFIEVNSQSGMRK